MNAASGTILFIALAAASGCDSAVAPGGPGATTPVSDLAPSAIVLEAHVRFLASDLLRGREPGTAGFDIAADYVESHFRQLGLSPAGSDNGYLQWVPLRISRADNAAASMEIHAAAGRRALDSLEDFVIDAEPAAASSSLRAPVVFAGFGVEAPDLGVDDYAGLDVEGKLVLTLVGTPGHLPTDEKAHLALFTRSDHYRFVQHGIPAMFFMCGMTARDPSVDGITELRRYVAEHLHRPSDEVDLNWDYAAAARYAAFVAEVTRDVADTEARPTWNEGDLFAQISDRNDDVRLRTP